MSVTEIRKVASHGVILKADASGLVEAIVNTTNVVDKQNDLMAVGCFSKVIREGQSVAICWAHNASAIVGKVLELRELSPGDPRVPANRIGGKASGNAGGLWVKAQFAMGTQAGREAFELCKGGFVNEWSVGFDVAPDGEKADPYQRDGVRTITMVDRLYECSLVLAGASPSTATLTAKSAYDRVLSSARSRAYWDSLGGPGLTSEEMAYWVRYAKGAGESAERSEKAGRPRRAPAVNWGPSPEETEAARATRQAEDHDAAMAKIYLSDQTAFPHLAPAYWRTLRRGRNPGS